MSELILVRGLPGSGKSTVAKSFGILHLEADMYFMQNGKYLWTAQSVHAAHKWCTDMVTAALANRMDVVVSNTFTQLKEFKTYLTLAEEYHYNVKVIRCISDYGNVHDVPQEALDRMKARFQDYEGETLIGSQI